MSLLKKEPEGKVLGVPGKEKVAKDKTYGIGIPIKGEYRN